MGAFNMHFVMRSLEGVSLTLPWGERMVATKKQKVGDTIMRDLDAEDMALLLTIAYRQHDRMNDQDGKELHKDVNWFCFGSKEALMRISHVKRHKFYDSRRFLIKAGLITHKDREYNRDISNLDSNKKRWYRDVYRLNQDKLAECLAHSRASENVPSGDSSVPQDDSSVPPGNPQITSRENNEKDNISKHGGVDDNKESAEQYRGFIATNLGVPPEEIGLSSVRKYALGKDPAKIAEIANKIRDGKGYNNKIAALVARLKELPKDDLTPEEMVAQFSAAERLPTAKTALVDPSIETGWNTLVKDLALEALDDRELAALKDAFFKAMQTHRSDKRPTFVNNFIARIKRENGGFEKLKATNPDIEQRVTLLRSEIEKEES